MAPAYKQWTHEEVCIETLTALHDELTQELSHATVERDPDQLWKELHGGPKYVHPDDKVYYETLLNSLKVVLRHYIVESEWEKYDILDS